MKEERVSKARAMRLEEAFGVTPLSERVTFEAFRRSCPSAHMLRRNEGQAVWTEGETGRSLVFVVEGRVKLVKRHPGGRDIVVDFVEVGGQLCQVVPYARGDYCCDAVADAPITRLMVVPRHEFMTLLDSETAAAAMFLQLFAGRTETLCERLTELGCGRVDRRIATLLLRLADGVGVRNAAGTLELPVKLSRRDLAELCGTTVETAIRAMRALELDGVVRTLGEGGFEIVDEAALTEIAGGASRAST